MAILDEYLLGIHTLLKRKDSDELQRYLRVEPDNLPDVFVQLCNELRASYTNNNAIDRAILKHIPQDDDDEGGVSASFTAFMHTYLLYWRDVDFNDLVETHSLLTNLTNACIQALSHNRGLVCLPACIQICYALAKLAMTLDKRPDLAQRVRKMSAIDSGESRQTLVEATAETIQKGFTTCLTTRTSHPSGIKDGKPEGKKAGIYSFANLVLKLLFQCRKTRLANQLFTNLAQNSPPLRLYSARQRVTFLYYLGRFQFSSNHFFYAQACLQASYDQCHSQFLSQKRLILIYLVASNMILGRFPSPVIELAPEAKGTIEKFIPIAAAIRQGDLAAFKRSLGPESGNEQWFFKKGLLLPLLTRCEVLVWRSLFRRIFVLTFRFPYDPATRQLPTVDLDNVVAAAQHCQKILEGWQRPVSNSLFVPSTDLVPPSTGPKRLVAHQGTVFGNKMPELLEIEAIAASLIQQGLLRGYIMKNLGKYAIIGSKARGGPLNAGFPSVWQTLKDRAEADGRMEEIPGWVKKERNRGGGVVNLSGIARPVGGGG